MTPDQKLSALLTTAARPEPQGFAFSADLAQRIARRRAIYNILAMVPVMLAAAALLWTLDGLLKRQQALIDLISALAPGLLNLALVLFLTLGGRMLSKALDRR